MVKAGNLTINPARVQSMDWDQRFYMNGPGEQALIVTMVDGTRHRIKHEPQYLGGVNAYEVERKIMEELERHS